MALDEDVSPYLPRLEQWIVFLLVGNITVPHPLFTVRRMKMPTAPKALKSLTFAVLSKIEVYPVFERRSKTIAHG